MVYDVNGNQISAIVDATLQISGQAADAKAAGDEIKRIKNSIGTENVETELIGTYQTGYFWNSQSSQATMQTVSSYSAFNPIPVTPGNQYTAYIRGGASSKQYPLLFTDASYNILEHSTRPSAAGFNTYTGTVPSGAVYALITANTINAPTLETHKYIETQEQLTDIPGIYTSVEMLKSGLADLNGKTVAIIGDSISTNGNYSQSNPFGNVPEIVVQSEDVGVQLSAYATYYDIGTVIGGHEITSADVGTELTFVPTADDVGKMVGVPLTYNSASTTVWWEVMQQELGFTPVAVCWSGSSVTSHEGNAEKYMTSYAWHDAQIRKCGLRTPGTMDRTAPDVIIIYRGTNDFSHGPYARLTSEYFSPYNWTYPETDALDGGGYGFKEGLCLAVKNLRQAYPNARIILCTLNVFKRINYANFPTNNGYASLPQYNEAIREVASFLGIDVIEFDRDGITFENMQSGGYVTESGMTHPTNKGHLVMGNKAIVDFMRKINDTDNAN